MSTRRDRAANAIAAGIWPHIALDDPARAEAYRIADMVLAEVDRVPDISELIEASSLGTPAAKAAIASVSDAQAQRALGVANRIRSAARMRRANGTPALPPHCEPESDCVCVCITHGTKQPCGCPCWRDHKTDDGAVRTGEEPTPLATGARSPGPAVAPTHPRLFELYRHQDVTGLSGTGTVAWGTHWPDGTVALRWTTEHPSTVHWDSLDAVLAIHGHSGATVVRWLDGDQ